MCCSKNDKYSSLSRGVVKRTTNFVSYKEVSFNERQLSFVMKRCRLKNDKFRSFERCVVNGKYRSLMEISVFVRSFSKGRNKNLKSR